MRVLALAMIIMMAFGCTGRAPQEPAPAPPTPMPQAPPAAQPPAPQPPGAQPPAPDGRFTAYDNLGVSFDYPKEMNVTEQASGYPARANILIQGKTISDGAIVVSYINASGLSSALPDPLEQAEKVLKSNTESESDIAGQAQVRGEITTQISPNGVPMAERTFILTKPGSSGNNITMYGHALEFYDGNIKASYAVRIFSTSQIWTDEMRARLVSSFRIG